VFRRYSFEEENEDVQCAAFFNLPTNPAGPSSSSSWQAKPDVDGTFGPFHRSQHLQWGGPRISTSTLSTSTSATTIRALAIFLRTRSQIYLPSGETITQNLPFVVQSAHALPEGLLLQRALQPRELRQPRHTSILTGLHDGNNSVTSVLDDVDIRDLLATDDGVEDLPRIYTMGTGFDELKPVEEGDSGGWLTLDRSIEVLFVAEGDYPYVLGFNTRRGEVIFYRRTLVPIRPEEPSPSTKTTRPEELLRNQGALPVQPTSVMGAKRPSLHRAPSTFSTAAAERRVSGATDPLDRTDRTQRRAPRLSKNTTFEPGDLQAALELPPFTSTTSKIPITRNRAVSSASAFTEGTRRLSGASAFVRDDMLDAAGAGKVGMGLGDLRETTMMMGLERVEGVVRSEMVLERIWVWKPPE
jgi:anaphase-promoting complex subunit 1